MKWMEMSVMLGHEATEAAANIFHEAGAGGVVIEDPLLINSYRSSGAWDYCDIPEALDTETVTVKAYLPVDDRLDDSIAGIEQALRALSSRLENTPPCGPLRLREVKEDDWANAWKQYFHPIRIGANLVIKPSWEDYEMAPDDLVVEIDPGMAFGTGTHNTTVLCMETLTELVRPGVTVFDIGAGSGILSLAAAKLGAASVRAVDLDPTAVRVASENVSHNNLDSVITVRQGDLLAGTEGKADIIVANIVADVILQLLPDVPARLNKGGYFVASGIISERLGEITHGAMTCGLTVDRVVERDGWAVVVSHKEED